MARATARGAPIDGVMFDILEDELQPSTQLSNVPTCATAVLDELSIDHCLNQAGTRGTEKASLVENADRCNSPHSLQKEYQWADKSRGKPFTKTKPSQPVARRRRLLIEPETFEPLRIVEEDAEDLTGPGSSSKTVNHTQSQRDYLHTEARGFLDSESERHSLISAEPNPSIREEVEKHLGGQFNWLMSYPESACPVEKHEPASEGKMPHGKSVMVYGCNLISRNRQSASLDGIVDDEYCLADSYSFLATPLGHASALPDLTETVESKMTSNMAWSQEPSLHGTPLKVHNVNENIGLVPSPSLTVVSGRSSTSFKDQSSPAGSFSIQRIEDSLEEIDKLEEQLEAVDTATRGRRVAQAGDVNAANQGSQTPSDSRTSRPLKRASVVGQFATVRLKNAEKPRPTIRRSSSMMMRSDKAEMTELAPDQKASSTLSRNYLGNARASVTNPIVKSTKPPTIAKFELPGEAVARRLKEQRDARQAQQAEAEAQKVKSTLTRQRSTKFLPKPTFELPGEAISRRKREEHAAKLRAQEEEERKKREFKARPMRQSVGPGTMPRETITSRVRQGKVPDDASKQAELNRAKRMSMGTARSSVRPAAEIATTNGSPQSRGRHSIVFPVDDANRGTSASTASAGGKRCTLTSEEIAQQKMRAKSIFMRDNFSFVQDKQREKREREDKAKTAREQAAERSRIASREWAERKRRKDLPMKEATHNARPPVATS